MVDLEVLHRKIKELQLLPQGEVHIIVLLENFVRPGQEDIFSLLAYADALRIVGRFSEAKALLLSVFDNANKYARAALAKTMALALKDTSPEEAEVWFARCLNLMEDPPGWAWIFRGANLAVMERYDAAIDCYNEALKVGDVDRDEALLNLGLVYRAKGDYAQALVYLNRSHMVSASKMNAELRAALQSLDETREVAKQFFGDAS